MLPSIEHNMLVASLLGYPYGGHNPWVGIYNYAYYDYYFANVNKGKTIGSMESWRKILFSDRLKYTNWAKNYPNHLHANIDKV